MSGLTCIDMVRNARAQVYSVRTCSELLSSLLACLQDDVDDAPEDDADNGADAMKLLRALAAADPAVQEKVKATDAAARSRPACSIM